MESLLHLNLSPLPLGLKSLPKEATLRMRLSLLARP
jgi:hypothetical protein